MKIATQLVHRAEGVLRDAEPLTTPIYETTTFVFDSAQEVRDYNEGRSKKFLYTRYGNPTLTVVEQKIARLEQADTATGEVRRDSMVNPFTASAEGH